jgi:hypothetical protein
MAAHFEDGGIRFRYPENWKLEREENEAGWTVSVQSPDTAFIMICFRDDEATPDEMAIAALDALKEEYPELESEASVDSVGGQPATGYDVRFFSLDLSNTCFLRSFYSSEGTVLVLWQANDLELERIEPVLRAICTSFEVNED